MLRGYLADLYSRAPGEPGALLAEPVLEAAFGWKRANVDMKKLAERGFLQSELVSAMDKPPRDYREYAFPRSRKPFQHQLDCWKLLLDETPRSLLVASGTGSGKTECFLVPILEDLARERAQSGALTGARALFLYPMNALINSQRQRLRAWCGGFGQDIRFCLYNGETRETAPAHEQTRAGAEQISRRALRHSPAPVLVTNPTMLEYMLVRAEDRPILQQSRGKLRWIVLDEAHTYIGSQAAEMALLLRRVLHSFDAAPSKVRFVATSATIGSATAYDQLKRFLADISGAPLAQVHIVTGKRFVPPLPPLDPKQTLEKLQGLESDALYNALCHHPNARIIRRLLAKEPAKFNSLREKTGLSLPEVTTLLEMSSNALHDDDLFLPLRIHVFHRAQRGLWACANSSCAGRTTQLSQDNWDFGTVFPERRTRCEHCQYPVFELVVCGECGQEYLSAEETFSGETGESKLNPSLEPEDIDEFQLDAELDDEEEVNFPSSSVSQRLICGKSLAPDGIEHWRLDNTRTLRKNGNGIPIRLSQLNTGPVPCPRCGTRNTRRRLLRELRIGAPFALSDYRPHNLGTHAALECGGRFAERRQAAARLHRLAARFCTVGDKASAGGRAQPGAEHPLPLAGRETIR